MFNIQTKNFSFRMSEYCKQPKRSIYSSHICGLRESILCDGGSLKLN